MRLSFLNVFFFLFIVSFFYFSQIISNIASGTLREKKTKKQNRVGISWMKSCGGVQLRQTILRSLYYMMMIIVILLFFFFCLIFLHTQEKFKGDQKIESKKYINIIYLLLLPLQSLYNNNIILWTGMACVHSTLKNKFR